MIRRERTKDDLTALAAAAERSLFVVWGPPSHGPRSRVLARELGIQDLHYVSCTSRRGLAAAPMKYTCQAIRTLQLLFQKRPRLVFVQSPPSLAVLFVFVYCALTRSQYVVDAHSAAFLSPYWTRPRWLISLLARKAVATIVTNDNLQRMVARWGGRAFVLPDIPTSFPTAKLPHLDGAFSVAVVNTFGSDEPLKEVLEAAAGLADCQFYVTGRKSSARGELLADTPHNVHFTDFLPSESYYALLSASQAVMCLSTRDNTMQRGACEALWLGKPIITSDWPLLRAYFHQGAVYVDNTSAGIRTGVLAMRERHREYQAQIAELQTTRRRQWHERSQALNELVQAALDRS